MWRSEMRENGMDVVQGWLGIGEKMRGWKAGGGRKVFSGQTRMSAPPCWNVSSGQTRMSTPPWALILVCMLAGMAMPARACSHFFDNMIFPLSDAEVLRAPVGDFSGELRRLGMKPPPVILGEYISPGEVQKREADLMDADVAELEKALENAKENTLPPDRKQKILDEYRALRVATRDRLKLNLDYVAKGPNKAALAVFNPAIPDGLPSEFDDYARGAAAYAAGDIDDAVEWWERLLLLPKARRQNRSVWAAYMIGRALVNDRMDARRERAVEAFHQARQMAAEGFSDRTGLAGASLGWEARAELLMGRFERAFALYFEANDAPSLADTAQKAFTADSARMAQLARDPLSVKVMIAAAVARGGPWRPEIKPEALAHLINALEKAQARKIEGADRIAWALYQNGDAASARRWLARADQSSLMARWLTSKLLLRDGKVNEASAILASLIREWPVNDEWNPQWEGAFFPQDRVVGELSMLTLARGQFLDAMDLLLRQSFFPEAAYIGERVLTVDELKAYVDRRWRPGAVPEELGRKKPDGHPYWNQREFHAEDVGGEIRYLLARRLVRLGRMDEARTYMPSQWRDKLDQYSGALREAGDETLSNDERGELLWKAAQIARHDGLELMGTELEPDFHSNGGMFGSWEPKDRIPTRARPDKNNTLTAATAAERARILAHHPEPDRRFHYRYLAAAQAWEAAKLLPDESDLKAQILWVGGSWISSHDVKGAAKFYRALVRDCGTTKMGRDARAAGWFP